MSQKSPPPPKAPEASGHVPSDYLRDVAGLARKKDNSVNFRLDAGAARVLASELGLPDVRKVSFSGEIRAKGREDWHLTGLLGATATQPCVVTLEPVTTRLDVPVERLFMAQMPEPTDTGDADDVDEDGLLMIDETMEPLGRTIDLWTVLREALTLALPDYPRSDSAELGDAQFTEPGKSAMTDDDAKPFAGLAGLLKSAAPDDSSE